MDICSNFFQEMLRWLNGSRHCEYFLEVLTMKWRCVGFFFVCLFFTTTVTDFKKNNNNFRDASFGERPASMDTESSNGKEGVVKVPICYCFKYMIYHAFVCNSVACMWYFFFTNIQYIVIFMSALPCFVGNSCWRFWGCWHSDWIWWWREWKTAGRGGVAVCLVYEVVHRRHVWHWHCVCIGIFSMKHI